MPGFNELRRNRPSFEMQEFILPQAVSTQESLKQWLQLQVAFEWQLQQTEKLYKHDRWAALINHQARLQRLKEK